MANRHDAIPRWVKIDYSEVMDRLSDVCDCWVTFMTKTLKLQPEWSYKSHLSSLKSILSSTKFSTWIDALFHAIKSPTLSFSKASQDFTSFKLKYLLHILKSVKAPYTLENNQKLIFSDEILILMPWQKLKLPVFVSILFLSKEKNILLKIKGIAIKVVLFKSNHRININFYDFWFAQNCNTNIVPDSRRYYS